MRFKNAVNKIIQVILIISVGVLTYIGATEIININKRLLINDNKQNIQTIDMDNIENIKHANVHIFNFSRGGNGSGTHIKINGKSYILTVNHLIHKPKNKIVAILDNNDECPLELIKIDKENDLALFRIFDVPDLPYLEISTEEPTEGSLVTVIGYPKGYIDIVTNGNICQVDKKGYMFTNLIYYGSSGGALLYKGKIVGVVTNIRTFRKPPIYVNYGYATKLIYIQEFLKGIK